MPDTELKSWLFPQRLAGALQCMAIPEANNKKARSDAGLRAFLTVWRETVRDIKSFPLNRPWRLAADIVNNTVNSTHFIDDAIGDFT